MMRIRLATVLMLLSTTACVNEAPTPGELDLGQVLGGSASVGFTMVSGPRQFEFPRDHGPHDGYRNEWWYLTGNLQDDEGRSFGYQLTFFRVALQADPRGDRSSRWATSHAWMAHLAVTDPESVGHLAAERFSREALDLAGATAEPFSVWVGPWRLWEEESGSWRLLAATDRFGLDLVLDASRTPLLQGDAGFSRKSAEPGNASYYYSVTRLETKGHVRVQDREYSLSGTSWLDREWSSSALAEDQVGWDWFALHLEDGSDLMFYQLRKRDGGIDPHSAGTLQAADGSRQRLASGDIKLQPVRWWRNVQGVRYPVGWKMTLGKQGRELHVEAFLDDQEMELSVRYWEGMVRVIENGRPVGRGYLEMTGYSPQ